MDIKTVILALAIGNFVLAVALILFQFSGDVTHRNKFWTVAKLLQGVGWILLFYRGSIHSGLSITLGNVCLLSGFAYECWAMYQISHRTVSRTLHISATICITLIYIFLTPLSEPVRVAGASFVACFFFFLSGIAVLRHPFQKSPLRLYTGWSMLFVAVVILTRGMYATLFPEWSYLFSGNYIQIATFSTFYYLMLVNGFGILMLAKESTDQELKGTLKEQKALTETLTQQKEQIEATIARMKRLEGIISICMHCKKIRNEQESWDQLETYITHHSDAMFSHGICPECLEKHYPI